MPAGWTRVLRQSSTATLTYGHEPKKSAFHHDFMSGHQSTLEHNEPLNNTLLASLIASLIYFLLLGTISLVQIALVSFEKEPNDLLV